MAFERDLFVRVVATPGEDRQRIRPLPDDLEEIAVRVLEIDALLAPVVEGTLDPDASVLQGEVGVLEILLAGDGECHVLDTQPSHRAALAGAGRAGAGVGAGEQIERVRMLAETEKNATMLGILL